MQPLVVARYLESDPWLYGEREVRCEATLR